MAICSLKRDYEYYFTRSNLLPICFIYNRSVSVINEYNIKRYYDTNRKKIHDKFVGIYKNQEKVFRVLQEEKILIRLNGISFYRKKSYVHQLWAYKFQ